jgi:uncharacterized protein with ACT and thioredoxin-like domain
MNIARTILAVFITVSVAVLPLAGGAVGGKSSEMSESMYMTSSGDMSVSMDMSDCCPHDSVPCDKSIANCLSMAGCASTMLSLSEHIVSSFVFPIVLTQLLPTLESQTFPSQTSSPPFRPPRA